ncbi:MAG TPA: LamG domain-containing protein [Flavobacterium alvei]|nr:LamG domain-containing protein [Flavobacterium alvei]HQF48081.1 LamG domain-containing protein [Flavobacterium alvei]
MRTNSRLFALLFIGCSIILKGQSQELNNNSNKKTEWIIADLLRQKSNTIGISGNPKIVSSPFGDAVSFNGTDDAIFLNELPLQSLQEFTVEMLFKPELNGQFEQRILHIGESKGDRMLLEIRALENNWYFDGYAASGTNKKTLIDEKLIHPLEKWYHVAFVVTSKSRATFVDGKQELREDFPFSPIQTGQTSIGVRMSKINWFKGAIYKIRIIPKEVNPKDFIQS